jgi:hypothetical protein
MVKDIKEICQNSNEVAQMIEFLDGVLYPITDPDEWAEIYGLEVMSCPCIACDAELILSKPFATKGGLRGLTSFPCECGEPQTPYVFTFK